jgi:hypothetical protein
MSHDTSLFIRDMPDMKVFSGSAAVSEGFPHFPAADHRLRPEFLSAGQ